MKNLKPVVPNCLLLLPNLFGGGFFRKLEDCHQYMFQNTKTKEVKE